MLKRFLPSSSTTTRICRAAMSSDRKVGVATPEELKEFIAKAGNSLLVADVRNPDAAVEPGDLKSFAVAPVPTAGTRPLAQLLIFDRGSMSMPLPEVPKDNPIITHLWCWGSGPESQGLFGGEWFHQCGQWRWPQRFRKLGYLWRQVEGEFI